MICLLQPRFIISLYIIVKKSPDAYQHTSKTVILNKIYQKKKSAISNGIWETKLYVNYQKTLTVNMANVNIVIVNMVNVNMVKT